MNRIGNLVVPNDNYCKFEDWVTPILDKMLEEQLQTGEVWTPSKVIRRLGKEINHEESVYYWAYKVRPLYACLLTGSDRWLVERHSRILPGADGRVIGRHDLLPFIPESRSDDRHRPGHSSDKRPRTESQESRDDHSGRRGLQAPNSKRNADRTSSTLYIYGSGLTRACW